MPTTPQSFRLRSSAASKRGKDTDSAILLVALAGVAFIVVGVLFSQNNAFYREFSNLFASPDHSAGRDRFVRVTIDFGNGATRAFQAEAQPSMTALTALHGAAIAGRIDFSVDAGGYVTAIGGVSGRNGRRWRLYRSGEPFDVAPERLLIGAGDRITFRYE